MCLCCSMRTGFVTHAIHMGQRHVELRTSFTVADDGSAVLHVSPLPGNPAVLGERASHSSLSLG